MHNINNNYRPGEATTMGRKKLINTFENAGFLHNDMFLPFPDYKMPSLIFYPGFTEKNEKSNINIESILSNISYQDTQQYTPLFSLDKALPLIAQNDLLYDLSNSFCIFSQLKPQHKVGEDILFAFYRTERKKEYCKETLFRLQNDEVKVIRNYLAKAPFLTKGIISFDAEEPAYSGILHHYRLVEIVNRDRWSIEQMGGWLAEWFECLKKELFSLYQYRVKDFSRIDLKVSSRYIDALPTNLIIQENGFRFIDLEINLDNDIELGYIIFRAIYVSLTRLSSVACPKEIKYSEAEQIIYELFSHLGYTLNSAQLDKYYGYETFLACNIAPVHIKTLKGAVSKLRVRPVIADYSDSLSRVEHLERQVHSLNYEIHSLSTSRKKLVKQLIKRTLPFLNVFF